MDQKATWRSAPVASRGVVQESPASGLQGFGGYAETSPATRRERLPSQEGLLWSEAGGIQRGLSFRRGSLGNRGNCLEASEGSPPCCEPPFPHGGTRAATRPVFWGRVLCCAFALGRPSERALPGGEGLLLRAVSFGLRCASAGAGKAARASAGAPWPGSGGVKVPRRAAEALQARETSSGGG